MIIGVAHVMHADVKVRRLNSRDADLPLPRYMSEEAAGMDLAAAVEEPITLEPLRRAAIPTGLALSIPAGFEGQVRPRSGLAARSGVTLANAPGTIDSDYRGELKVLLVNLGTEPYVVRRGERIAQLVISPVARARLMLVEELEPSGRGENGFGSSGS